VGVHDPQRDRVQFGLAEHDVAAYERNELVQQPPRPFGLDQLRPGCVQLQPAGQLLPRQSELPQFGEAVGKIKAVLACRRQIEHT
jgi:hypothetical protein